ncbi:MAG TPA: ABC transporter ATP-binding protein [Candidatus Limnocylindrales bacterium]|jgi:ABC-2 type transport system ATP-binding protein
MARKRARVGRAASAAEAGQEIAIQTHRLTKAYGELIAVDNLNLTIRAGEIFGLLGPNGAGKTTTILMLLGLSEPTSGRAEVVGFDPTREPLEVKRRVGYLPDDVGFYGGLSGRQNLRYTAALNGLDRSASDVRIGDLLEQVGLDKAADRPVEEYSRGMRQRLGLADALVKDPSIVILDEPTASIDPAGVTDVLAIIEALARDRGVTVLLSSHLLHQVHQICDRVAIFNRGRILAQGKMADLAESLAGDQLELEVGIDGPVETVEAALRAVPGVVKVTRDPHDAHLWRVSGPQSIRNHIATDLAARGMGIRQLRRVGDELDEIYLRYFQRDEGDRDHAA